MKKQRCARPGRMWCGPPSDNTFNEVALANSGSTVDDEHAERARRPPFQPFADAVERQLSGLSAGLDVTRIGKIGLLVPSRGVDECLGNVELGARQATQIGEAGANQ